MKEIKKDPYSKNPTFDVRKGFNKLFNTCVRADKITKYDKEISKEIYVVNPQNNDLYEQNKY